MMMLNFKKTRNSIESQRSSISMSPSSSLEARSLDHPGLIRRKPELQLIPPQQ